MAYLLLVKVPRPKDDGNEGESGDAGEGKAREIDTPLPHTLVRVPAYH